MATVRIYKVAELLGMSSQEATTLLKQETGIDVKSASSSIEEIVARQFVERHARKRQITLPAGPLFADAPAPKKSSKAPEPPKPTTPVLRPRLVKVVKPAAAPGEGEAETAHATAPVEEHVEAEPAPPSSRSRKPWRRSSSAGRRKRRRSSLSTSAWKKTPPVEPKHTPAPPPAPVAAAPHAPVHPPVAAAPPPPAAPVVSRPPGRIVPPTRRLRIEDPLTGEAPAARPIPQRPVVRPQPSVAAPTRPAAPGTSPKPTARPLGPSVRPPLGGPRPLPSQPIRPPSPPGSRPPGMSRPMPPRPSGMRSKGPRRDDRPLPPLVHDTPPPITKLITLAEGMTVKDLADKLELKVKDVLKKLLDRRMMLTINSTLDADTAQTIAREFGAEVLIRSFEEELVDAEAGTSNPEDLAPRAPVVTVMGHVDHGKTTLLDAIRKTKVAAGESGGITQHIGAYSVDAGSGRRVVFLDTPGHAAFTMMRAAARVTDIVVLVVAADDGIMPQTQEAIDHARAAKVPIVVAINKIDKPDANPERVKRELSDRGLMPEEWGGTTVTVEVSARQGKNLDQLLEMILLVADIADLKANPKRMAQGTVIEAQLDRAAVRSPRCWSRTARSTPATCSSPAPSTAKSARCSTTWAARSRAPGPRCRSRCSGCRLPRCRATRSR